ncbi:hypothetical protein QBC36DRAFT_357082 [Triangularia setosa]|uniref:Uncharacterized protein n=1 Tax=Triangularia setosa TaxID=2587417 RepID=A0AAN7A584_9PEZI|nr:hypothetical protein QBC36DRAFT_357082 [Podospora setosa]
MAAVEDVDAVSSQAREAFLSALPADQCNPISELGPSATAPDVFGHYQKPLVDSILKILAAFMGHIEPYFKVVEIFVSLNPEWAAITWGALRLVLQGASVSSTVANSSSDGSAPSPRLKAAVQEFYRDLLGFFCQTALVFMKKGGNIKDTDTSSTRDARVSKRRFTEASDYSRYTDAISSSEKIFVRQQRLLEKLQKQHTTHFTGTFFAMSLFSRPLNISNVLHHNRRKPPEFMQEYEQATQQRNADTGAWLFQTVEFQHWRKSYTGLYFNGAYRALLSQVFQQHPDDSGFRYTINFTMTSSSQAQRSGSPGMIRDLLKLSLKRHIGPKYVVIDGLDECQEDEDQLCTLHQEAVDTSAHG